MTYQSLKTRIVTLDTAQSKHINKYGEDVHDDHIYITEPSPG